MLSRLAISTVIGIPALVQKGAPNHRLAQVFIVTVALHPCQSFLHAHTVARLGLSLELTCTSEHKPETGACQTIERVLRAQVEHSAQKRLG
jgi:hypothetical protein